MAIQPCSFPLVNGYHPATYRERGLAAPFTSPVLSGARLRRIKNIVSVSADARAVGHVLEVVVPNWAGGRGVYIVPWPAVRELFRPTVHDIRLGEAAAQSVRILGDLHPAELRRITREVGRDGFAGRATAAATADALRRAELRGVETFAVLLRELASQLGLAAFTQAGVAATLAAAARSLNRPEADLAALLRQMAPHFAELGIGESRGVAPLPQMIVLIRGLQQDATNSGRWNNGPAAAASLHVSGNAQLMSVVADKAISIVRRKVEALPALLKSAWTDPTDTMAQLERPAWIVDGWEAITLLWRTALARVDRSATLTEAAVLVPTLPDELDRWLDFPAGTAAKATASSRPGRLIPVTASPLELIARNEHIRALAA